MVQAAIYVRVSTAGQVEDGLGQEAQLEECYRIAERFELEVDPDLVFIEQASGEFLGRDKLDLLRSHVINQTIEAVICYDIDRLSREEADTMVLFKEAKENGVQIYTRHGVNGNDRIDNLLVYIRAFSAADEKDKIRRRTMDGKNQAVKLAKVLPCGTGIGLFGYDYVPRSGEKRQYRKINEAEALVVRAIFDKARGGWEVNTITRDLNAQGILSKTGKKWHRKSVLELLKNPAYMGTTLYGRTKTTLKARGQRDLQYRNPEDVLEVEGFTPPIISEDTYNVVQRHLNRPRRSGHPHAVYMLSGMSRCGECGSTLTGQKMGRNERYRYYACRHVNNYRDGNKCGSKRASVASTDARIWQSVLKVIRTPELLLETIGHYVNARKAGDNPPPVNKKLMGELRRVRKHEEALLKLIKASPSAAESIAKELESVAKEKQNLEAVVMANTPRGGSGKAEVLAIKDYLGTLSEVNTDDVEKRKAFLKRIGFQATISSGGETITASMEMPELFTIEQTSATVPNAEYSNIPLPIISLEELEKYVI